MTDKAPITNDPATWPKGDRIWDICRAIAKAEGYNVAGSNPFKLNNPGDISDGWKTFGGEPHSGSNITKFPNPETGWLWLYQKIENVLKGKSTVFDKGMTWYEFGKHYCPPNWQIWADNVAASLHISPDTTVEDYVNTPGSEGEG